MRLTIKAFLILCTTSLVLAQDAACLPKSPFEVMVTGCNYNSLLNSIQQMLDSPDIQTHSIVPCPHEAEKELSFHLPLGVEGNSFINSLCKTAVDNYSNDHLFKWSDVTEKGDKFDKEYYDGNTDWNEEHQSNYPHPPIIPGEASNVLSRDAERVDKLYENELQKYPLQWPGNSPILMSNFEECQLQSVMCCWASDRQANDNNGNCRTPYDEQCLDADPADNTDLCAVDMNRSGDSPHVDGGFTIYHDTEEGPIHCHGLAWGENTYEADFRYRANNLFYVSMSDHMHDRGYVRNIQGAPMCGCVEKMPIVSRSDCTEITAKEFYKFTFPSGYSGDINASIDYVDLDFNACNARRNNDLQSFIERLLNEGRISREKYHKFRETIVGNGQCANAIRDLYFEKGYSYIPRDTKAFTQWQDGFCVNTSGRDQNSGQIKLGSGELIEEEECLRLCSLYTAEHRVTGCELYNDDQGTKVCYAHTYEVYRGNGVSNHKCAVLDQYEPSTKSQFLPAIPGYCRTEFGHDQNDGQIKLWAGDFGPSEERQMECLEMCIKASAVRRVTGCEAIWGQSNRGCYLHTNEVAQGGKGNSRHSCWVL